MICSAPLMKADKITVDDRVTMTGKLMSPDVKYDIYLPNADEETRLEVSNAISSAVKN